MERVRLFAAVCRPVGLLSTNHYFIRLAFFVICVTGSLGVVAAQNSNDRGTPADSKKGQSNQSTYSRDKIETVNLTNGNLSLSIPLATVGGRGDASFTITLNYNSRVWSTQSDGNGMSTGGGAMGNFRNIYSAMYDKQNPEDSEPYMTKLGGGWSFLWAPGIKMLKVGVDPIRSGCNNTDNDQPFCGYKYVLSKMWVTLPDGSQLEMRDVATQGAPSLTTHVAGGYHYFEDQDRGRVWRSIDGSNVVFVRDTGYPVGSAEGEHEWPTGWVFLPNGTRIRMTNGVGKKIIDRNGNFILLEEDGGWTDQLGRRTFMNRPEGLVTVEGYMGVPNRSISANFGTIGDATNLRDDYHSWPRPFTTGDARDVGGGEDSNYDQHTIETPHTDLFLNSEGIRAYGSEAGFDVGTATALTRVNLPDGRSIRFRYNPWGEVAEIIYPGGGVSQIDYGGHITNCEIHASFNVGRGVSERRTLKANGSVEGTWAYGPDAITINGVILPGVAVAVYQGTTTGTLLSSERHFFKAQNAEYRPCAGPLTLTGNEKWENNKEFRTEVYTGSGMRVITREWQQRANLVWNSAYVNDAFHGQEQPPNDPRVTWEETTLEDGKTTRVEYGYDQFNNVTSIKEYDFNTSGSTLLRQTVREYGTNINGLCYSNLNPTDSSCGNDVAGNVSTIIYQPGLLISETIYDGGGTNPSNQKAKTSFEYDNYASTGNRPPMTINSGMIQYDSSRFVPPFSGTFEPRGNLTKTTRWFSGGADVVSTVQYDNAGQVVWSKDPNGNVSTVSYVDDFGTGASPGSGVSGLAGATFAFPTLSVNAVGHNSRMQYDYSFGAVTGAKDPNNVVTKTEYDNLGRSVRVTAALGLSEQSIAEMSYPTAQVNSAKVSKQLDVTRWITTKTDFDGFDQPIISWQSESGQGLSTETFTIRIDTIYDALGRAIQTSDPYRNGMETAVYTETGYDINGRVILVKTPDNAVVRTFYDGNRVLVIDQAGGTDPFAGKKRISATDALGRLSDVWEMRGEDSATEPVSFPEHNEVAFGYRTTYKYNELDNLTEAIQGNQPHRIFTYDSLGRLLSASNPESGLISYQYDPSGNLLVKTDARLASAHYEYDGLNRIKRRWYNGSNSLAEVTHNSPSLPAGVGASDEAKYFYDSQDLLAGAPVTPEFNRGYSIGRMVAVTYGGGSNGDYYGYDAQGRIKPKIQRTGGINYKIDPVYNLAGSVTSQSYPSGHYVNNNYDALGRLADKDAQNLAFTGNLGDNILRTYASISGSNAYDSSSRMQEEKFGTAAPVYHKLHYNVRGQLYDIRVSTADWQTDQWNWNRGAILNWYDTTSGFPAQNPNSGIDNNGNLRRQRIFVPDNDQISSYHYWQQDFSYDALNRLTSVVELTSSTTPSFSQSYGYDRFGNRTITGALGTGINNLQSWIDSGKNQLYAPSDQNEPNLNNRLIRYDAAGNQKADYYSPGWQGTRTHDAENRMKSATDLTNNTSTYVYDGDGKRIARIVGGTETWQVYGIGGELLAEYPANTVAANPQKEYGYRNDELLITADRGNPSIPVFSDDFNDNALDASKWTVYYPQGTPAVSEQNQQMQFTLAPNTAGYNGVYSNATFDLTGRAFQVEVSQAVSQSGWAENMIEAVLDGNNYFLIDVGSGSLTLRNMTGGANDQSVIGYDGGSMRFWRIRHEQSSNTIKFETSGDGLAWTIRKSVAVTFSLTALRLHLLAGAWGTGNGAPGVAKYDNVQVITPVTTSSVAVPNSGFETPVISNLQYGLTGGSWTFYGAGISANGGGFGSSAPEGAQVAFLQGGPGSYISQSIGGFEANTTYTVTFSAAQRGNCCNAGGQDFQIYLDNNLIGTFHPGSASFSDYSTTAFTTTAGTHTLKFHGTNPLGGDHTAFIDNVRISGVPAPGQGVLWLVSDQLGTPRMVLDETGSLANMTRHDYLPFGEEVPGNFRAGIGGYGVGDNVRQKFTLKERDNETGLDYFLARYYSSAQGRFLNPDEFAGGPDEYYEFHDLAAQNPTFYADLTDPQSLNKYQYAYNNPLLYIDPDGHQSVRERFRQVVNGTGKIIKCAVNTQIGVDKAGINLFTGILNISTIANGQQPIAPLETNGACQTIAAHQIEVLSVVSPAAGKAGPATVMAAEAEETAVVSGKTASAGAASADSSAETSTLGRSVTTRNVGAQNQKTITTVQDRAGSTTYKTTPGRTGGQSTTIIRKDTQGNVRYVKQEARHRTTDFNRRPDHVHYKRPKNKEVF